MVSGTYCDNDLAGNYIIHIQAKKHIKRAIIAIVSLFFLLTERERFLSVTHRGNALQKDYPI